MQIDSFYITFCGQTKHVLSVSVATSTGDTSGHGITLMLTANVGIKSASTSAFGLESSRILPDRLTAQLYRDFQESVPPGLLKVVAIAVR
jgi:hypothetical protein